VITVLTVTTDATRSRPGRLRRARLLAGLSLLEVSHRTGIDPSQLSRIERGSAGLTTERLGRLAPVLELSTEDIAEIVTEGVSS
jgi:transcriptional regulator with XRE-family HTH domain